MQGNTGNFGAILLAGAMIAAAIYFQPGREVARYETLSGYPLYRFDRTTGKLEYCELQETMQGQGRYLWTCRALMNNRAQ